MFDTFALLISEVYDRLGHLGPEFLSPEDIAAGLQEELALRGLMAQQSSQSRISKSVPLTINARDASITGVAPDIMLPSYLERKIGTEPNENFIYVPSYGPSYLEGVRNRGESGCAFYLDSEGWRVTISYNPDNYEHRLHYYADPLIPQTVDDPLPLPKRFFHFFAAGGTKRTAKRVIARNISLPFDEQLNSGQLQALGLVVAAANADIEEWLPLWTRETQANKNTKAGMRRPILSGGGGSRRTYNG